MTGRAIQAYTALPYTRMLVPDEGGGYFARVLELPGCLADGSTPDEAIQRLEDSMEAWIDVALESGKPIPKPLASQGYSGRFVLRMPRWIHKEVARRAQMDGVSLNQWIVEAIGERLGAEGYADRLIAKRQQGDAVLIMRSVTLTEGRATIPLSFDTTQLLTNDFVRLPEPPPADWTTLWSQERQESPSA